MKSIAYLIIIKSECDQIFELEQQDTATYCFAYNLIKMWYIKWYIKFSF